MFVILAGIFCMISQVYNFPSKYGVELTNSGLNFSKVLNPGPVANCTHTPGISAGCGGTNGSSVTGTKSLQNKLLIINKFPGQGTLTIGPVAPNSRCPVPYICKDKNNRCCRPYTTNTGVVTGCPSSCSGRG
eukprot:GFUD01062001.1.p1 GENE.GFUD01062001.1~~GFUD01062001.1.p1  ORF type:complete len:132 (+),score=15.97 GFUD01062001.1:42-437(+)